MHTFKLALRVVSRHWIYLTVYLVLVSIMGLFITTGYSADGKELKDSVGRVAVVDRDGSTLTQGLAAYLAHFSVTGIGMDESDRGLTPVDDDLDAISDLVAQDVVSYVIVFPQGYGTEFMAAAKQGSKAPTFETVVSYQSGSGVLMDLRATQYLQAAYGFAGTLAEDDQAKTVKLTDETVAERAEVVAIPSEVESFSPRLVGYFGWCTYPLFTAATVLVSVLMKSLNQSDMRRRMLAAPTSASSRTLQTYCACLVLGVVSWAWVCGLGIAVDGPDMLATNAPQLALMALALLAYALMSVSAGFLIGQFVLSEAAANALANVGGTLLSFLGGAWVSLELLGENVQSVARLTPSYWCGIAVNEARDISSFTLEQALPSLASTGIVLLFALVFAVASFAVAHMRMRDA